MEPCIDNWHPSGCSNALCALLHESYSAALVRLLNCPPLSLFESHSHLSSVFSPKFRLLFVLLPPPALSSPPAPPLLVLASLICECLSR